jgi:hypothetical protein
MNKKLKIFIPSMIIAVVVGGLVLFNKPSHTPPHTDSVIPLEDMSDQNKADMAINEELNLIFKEADDHFVKGEFEAAIVSYKKVSENPKYSMIDYGEFAAPGLAEGSIEEVKCVQKYEMSKVKRTPEETVQGLLLHLHKNGPELLDYISCRVCESAWLDTTCNFLDRDSVAAALLGQDLDRGLLASIKVGAKTFIKEESPERGTLYRVTNETENPNDDVLLHLGAHPFAPERYRVEDIYRMEK